MRFVRAVWKILVGIKDALVLLFLLLFFGLLYAGLSARPDPVHDGILALDLDGTIVEQPRRASTLELLSGTGGRIREFSRADLVAAIDSAREDDRVKAIALDLDGFMGGGQVAIGDVGAALSRARQAGKPVLAYATGYTDDGYQLAAHASQVWLNPMGVVALSGPGGSNLYFAGLFDKLGVTANVYRAGTYKAAVEPFTRRDMSAEARENAQALAGALLETWSEDVTKARPAARIGDYLRDPVRAIDSARGNFAEAAKAAGLVDRVDDRRAWQRELARLGGEDRKAEGGYRTIPLTSYLADTAAAPKKAPIGVVTVAGTIVDGEAMPGTAGGATIARLIGKALADKDIRALVVRVDSPGGSVTASEDIRQALLAARERKVPVVVSMGNVAASGGYWVATAADHVLAEPATITGSIGVFGILPSFEGTLAKLGIGADGVKTTPLSGEPDLLKGPSPEADRLIQAGVDQTYRRFLGLVAEARRKPVAEVDRIAQGRVWDGGSARQLGLVDAFGGMDEAIAKAGELAGIAADQRKVRYLERPQGFRETLLEMLAEPEDDAEAAPTDALATLAPAPEALLARALDDLGAILRGPSIQARCLACPPVAAAPRPQSVERSWWVGLLGG